MTRARALLVSLLLLLCAAALAGDRTAVAERLLRMLHARDFDDFYAQCTDDLRASVPLPQLRALVIDLGTLDTLTPRGVDGDTYVFRANVAKGPFDASITLDAKDRVAGLWYKPAQPVVEGPIPNGDYKTRARLSLPFRGAWKVANGGRDPAKNNHVGNAQQNFAYDFVRGRRGDGRQLEDYEAWGADVLAPADATVAQVVDGVPDLEIGDKDPYVIPGNHVVLDFGGREYAWICHFQRGTIRVKRGQKVARGELLGKCGNSGNTTEPHIHFHLQDDPVFHHGKGLPAPFTGINVDGKPADGAVEPARGQRVENAK